MKYSRKLQDLSWVEDVYKFLLFKFSCALSKKVRKSEHEK